MGLFSRKKKKVPPLPFPAPKAADEQSLQFPSSFSREKVIEPSRLKKAAGIEHHPLPHKRERRMPMPPPSMPAPAPLPMPMPRAPVMEKQDTINEALTYTPAHEGPLYMKKNVYEHVLTSLEGLDKNLKHWQTINKALLQSEYTEEHQFTKLKRHVKTMHDKLLQVDTILFKAGE